MFTGFNMADFIQTINTLWQVEHNGDPSKILHYNKKEKSYTFYGIYPYTKLKSHKKIIQALKRNNWNIKKASRELANDIDLYQEVLYFYYENYWSKLKLDFIDSTLVAKELMVFAINIGLSPYRLRTIVKIVQRIVNKSGCDLKVDGIMGYKTIKCLNSFNDIEFSKLFDDYEIKWYYHLVDLHPRLKWALRGWINRAKFV